MSDTLIRTYAVEPSRLVGLEGDIRAAYSADTIAMEGRIRKPFKWEGKLFIATSFNPGSECQAYTLVPLSVFDGTATTYKEKTGTSEAAEIARHDPNGFYHGMAVKSGKETLILCGPPAQFVAATENVPAKPQQMTLFMEDGG